MKHKKNVYFLLIDKLIGIIIEVTSDIPIVKRKNALKFSIIKGNR